MKFRAYAIPVLATAALLVGACTANVTVPPGAGGGAGQASGSALEAYTATRGDAEVRALGELRPYRVEETGEDWVVYYYSPESAKSYRCVYGEGRDVVVQEVTSSARAYREGDEIVQADWQVDSEQARNEAIQAVKAEVDMDLDLFNVSSLVLVSAEEFSRLTGLASDAPVWICRVEPEETAEPSPEPSASPSASPSPEPTTAPPTVVQQITTVYINAKNGNKIAVNTGDSVDTRVETETEVEAE